MTAIAIEEIVTQLHHSFSAQRSRPLNWRIAQLRNMERMLTEHSSVFSAALAEDLGKSETEAWTTEIGFLLNDIKHTLKHIRKWVKPRNVSSPLAMQPATSRLTPEPLGVVLVFGAWNYPLQLTLSPVIAAIAAGNCVCVKPSEVSPAVSAAIAQYLPQYLDTDCVQVVEGDAQVAGQLLSQRFSHIFYTGGGQVGKKVMRAAADHLTPVTLELGGKSPVVVSRHADIAATARRIVWGKFLNAGQTCIAPDYVLVEASVHTQLVTELKAALTQFYGDDPEQSDDYGRIVAERHIDRLAGLLNDPELQHAQVHGGEVNRASRYFAPTVIDHCPAHAKVMDDEIFGPILPIIEVENLPEAYAFIQSRAHPLACYVFTKDKSEQVHAEHIIQCGSLCFNDTMVFMLNPALPFGGVGASGMGRYHGQWGFDQLSHLKPVVHRSFMFDIDVRYPPYTKAKQKMLKKLL
ncbi:aldehyde dehydrogenase family protein [Aliidiomarina celeris]|uniref:aldehyde dehydrogenase family protein n=1 Tax=Aliidiomarina celeris TaxID=2249428 RepID=UPI000DE8A975|nr:aldehyde dehydrogenase family protein [Aliidiomarina celeris]